MYRVTEEGEFVLEEEEEEEEAAGSAIDNAFGPTFFDFDCLRANGTGDPCDAHVAEAYADPQPAAAWPTHGHRHTEPPLQRCPRVSPRARHTNTARARAARAAHEADASGAPGGATDVRARYAGHTPPPDSPTTPHTHGARTHPRDIRIPMRRRVADTACFDPLALAARTLPHRTTTWPFTELRR